jgi:hypothetical protein
MKGYGVIVHETHNFGYILFAFVRPSVRPSHICFTRTTPTFLSLISKIRFGKLPGITGQKFQNLIAQLQDICNYSTQKLG